MKLTKVSVVLTLCLTSLISGCILDDSPSSPPPTPEEIREQNQQRLQLQLDKIEKTKKFLNLCETNGGVKEFNNQKYCGGRSCYGTYIECNNGLSAWMNQ